MNKYNVLFLLTIMIALSGIWVANSFAAFTSQPSVEGLTVKEAEKKYGTESENNHSWIFEVNNESGNRNCVSIGPDCSKACPTPKIFYQSKAKDDSSTIKVDIYYDNNEVVSTRDPSC
ncbi:hypothetical protein KKHLCK_04235 [Candidatus Electrothrix laxa]